jgi:hypothetical protein
MTKPNLYVRMRTVIDDSEWMDCGCNIESICMGGLGRGMILEKGNKETS